MAAHRMRALEKDSPVVVADSRRNLQLGSRAAKTEVQMGSQAGRTDVPDRVLAGADSHLVAESGSLALRR